MNILAPIFGPLNHCARDHREANRQQSQMLLRATLEDQYELMSSTDPEVRAKALDEIERIEPMLRAST